MNVKLCPECGSEYFAHVIDCAECKVTLVTSVEIERERAEEERFAGEVGKDAVAVIEGRVPLLKELRKALLGKGITSFINLSPGCKPGGCNSTSLLFVARKSAEAAVSCIKKHQGEELSESMDCEEEMDDENCPACGFEAGAKTKECPDCGLALVFDEE